MPLSFPLISFASYVACSTVALYRPQWLFSIVPKLNQSRGRHMQVTHSSHRGGAAERPENTLSAFDHAVSLKSDLLELDVHLTRDGHVIVTHDHTIDRVTNGTGHVTSFNHSDIPTMKSQLLLPPPFHKAGSFLDWRPPHDQPDNSDHSSFPLLSTVFEQYPNSNINIDCKHESEQLVNQVATLIEKYKRQDKTIWGSGSDRTAQRCYARNPNIPLFFSGKQTLFLALKYMSGLLPFLPIKESFLEVPLFTPELRTNFSGVATHLTRTRSFFLYKVADFYQFLFTRPSFIQHLQKRGIKVIYWVLNTESEFEQAFSLGADGVMTDYPTRLRQYLNKREQRQARSNDQ